MKAILYNLIILFSSFIIIASIVGSIYYKKLNKPLKIIHLYTIQMTILCVISTSLSIKGINNLIYTNIQTTLEFIILSIVFTEALDFKKRAKRILYSFLISLWSFCVIYHYVTSPLAFDNLTTTISSFTIVTLSVTYLIQAFKKEIKDNSIKIISIGAFMSFSSTLLIGLLGNSRGYLTPLQLHWVYLINSVFFMFFSILITIGFIICGKNRDISN